MGLLEGGISRLSVLKFVEFGFPAAFEFSGHQAVVWVNRLMLAGGQLGFVLSPLQLVRPLLRQTRVFGGLVLHNSLERIQLSRLQGLEKSLDDALVDRPGIQKKTRRVVKALS